MNCDAIRRRASTAAFTLIELLVTIAIIGILVTLGGSALAQAKRAALQTACISNFKQFGVALQLYADDHNDAVLPNKDGQNVPLGQTWVQGWLGVPGPDTTNTLYLTQSLIGHYIPNISLWRCPAAKNSSTAPGVRVRTFSLNAFMGAITNTEGAATYSRISDIVRPSPSQAVTFVDERIDTINDGSFALQKNFSVNKPESWILRDKPASQHRGAASIATADSHVEIHAWKDPRTATAPRDDAVMPGNRDIRWLQEHSTWRD
jgi:prepilin-type N-terminal cleavage/methylation domain-containing protein